MGAKSTDMFSLLGIPFEMLEPDDLEGWRQQAKAYEVLGNKEKAEHARKKAEALQK